MKKEILSHLDEPESLEALYRKDKTGFAESFAALSSQIPEHPASKFWMARLRYMPHTHQSDHPSDLFALIGIAIAVIICSKIPDIFGLRPEAFYPRQIGFFVFSALGIFLGIKHRLSGLRWLIMGLGMLLCLIYINIRPGDPDAQGDVAMLLCMHLPLLLWALTGFAYMHGRDSQAGRLAYLRFSGDWLIMSGLVFLAGMLLSGITIVLFSMIDLKIADSYFETIGISGLSVIPLIAGYLVERNPELVGKIAPMIARLFSPLALLVLIAFLISISVMGKNPYTDREFLLIFNVVLLAVVALVFFSVTGGRMRLSELWILAGLSLITILINAIALSAIAFRISEWGFTPNRTAVLGSNALLLIHLVLVFRNAFQTIRKKATPASIAGAITMYLPVYLIWAALVCLLFPLIFGMN